MTGISTHVLDAVRGRPARGVPVTLTTPDGTAHDAVTDDDGRVTDLLGGAPAVAGPHRLRFDTGAWFAATGQDGFYPEVLIAFTVEAGRHHHVPLLLSPYAYSTYRGS